MAQKKAVGTDYVPANYPQHNKTIKKKKVKKTSKRRFWLIKVSPVMAIIAIIFLISLGLVAQHVWINFLGHQVNQLNKNIASLQETNEKLKLQIASLGSLERIERVATNELGMINPKNVQYIYANELPNIENNSLHIASTNSYVNNSKEQGFKEVSNQAWLGTIRDSFFTFFLKEEG